MNLIVVSLNQEPTSEEKRAQLRRIIESAGLQNAPMLQKLLGYVGASSMDGNTPTINEWVIATTVFGRPEDFDAATDTTVRTAVYRLRLKLREYYAVTGKNDPVVIEIPKGHHVPVFTKRLPSELDSISNTPPLLEAIDFHPVAEPVQKRRSRFLWIWAAVALFCAGAVSSWLVTRHANRSSEASRSKTAQFWYSFAGSNRSVIVAYSNAELLQTDKRDLLRWDVGAVDDRGALVDQALAERSVTNPDVVKGHKVFYEDGYTGTGEVQAVYVLTRLLTQLGFEVSVKRVRLLTSDDFKLHQVVLLGSPLENRALNDLHVDLGYSFEMPLNSMWAGGIRDRRNHNVSYAIERDARTQALQADYAVVSVVPGVTNDRRIIILGGLTTSGTEGAAEFVSSDNSISELLQKLSLPLTAPMAPFEAVVQVRVVRGLDPVNVKCIAARFPSK